jgi:hypothetical protein
MHCGCGGSLESAVWKDGKYVPRSSLPSKPLGEMVRCSLCGHRRREKSGSVKRLTEQATFTVLYGPLLKRKTVSVPLSVGDYICWFHSAGYPTMLTAMDGTTPAVAKAVAAVEGRSL